MVNKAVNHHAFVIHATLIIFLYKFVGKYSDHLSKKGWNTSISIWIDFRTKKKRRKEVKKKERNATLTLVCLSIFFWQIDCGIQTLNESESESERLCHTHGRTHKMEPNGANCDENRPLIPSIENYSLELNEKNSSTFLPRSKRKL